MSNSLRTSFLLKKEDKIQLLKSVEEVLSNPRDEEETDVTPRKSKRARKATSFGPDFVTQIGRASCRERVFRAV